MTELKKVHVIPDGILEEDNHLPNWWLATFFGAIIFAFGYWQYYHVLAVGEQPGQEYAAFKKERLARLAREAALATATGGISAEKLLAMSKGAEAKAGEQVFMTTCMPCHGAQGEGKIGPNLTDSAWIHGEEPLQIRESVDKGYALKGMPSWGPVLGQEKLNSVVAFVLTLKGRNVPGKAPEGPGGATAPAAAPAPGAAAPAPDGSPAAAPVPAPGAAPAPAPVAPPQ